MQFSGRVELLERTFLPRAQKLDIETQFRARRIRFELVEQRLVEIGEIANRVRTFVVNVINSAYQRVRRGFALVESAERFDFARKAIAQRWQDGRLACQKLDLPVQSVLHQHCRFVVKIMPRRQNGIALFRRDAIHHVALSQPARRTRFAVPACLLARDLRNRLAVGRGDVNDMQCW